MGIFNKKVLATLTDEEAQVFDDFNNEEQAIKEMQDSLVDKMTNAVKGNKAHWKEIRKKYDLPDSLKYNSDTHEITCQ